MATGSDILSYKGQADLGYGPGDSPAADSNSLDNFNETLRQVNQQQFQWNAMKYQQKIKDRDDTLAVMANQNVDSPVRDEDRPALDDQISKMKDILVQNPDIKSNPKAYLDFQNAVSKFKGMKAMAQTRYATLGQQQQDIANNPDAEDRKSMQAHFQQQVDGGVTHLPDPYQKMQSFDPAITTAAPPPEVTPGGVVVGKDGLAYRQQTTGSNLDDFTKFYDGIMTEAPGKNTPNQIAENVTALAANKDFNTPANYDAINAKLEAINQANNLKPRDPKRLLPFTDSSGVPTSNPAQFMMDVALAKNYQLPTTSLTLDKDAQKGLLTAAQQKLAGAKTTTESFTQRLKSAQAGKEGALATKARAEANLANEKAKQVAPDSQAERDALAAKGEVKIKSASAVDEVVHTMNRLYTGNNFKPIADAVPPSALSAITQATGIDGSYQVASVPTNDLSAQKMLSVPKYSGGAYSGVTQPTTMIVARSTQGGINKTILIGLNKDGQVMKTVNANNAIGEVIKYDNGYNRNKSTMDQENAADAVVKEAQGSKAAGTDIEAIIRNNGVEGGSGMQQAPKPVAPATPQKASAPAKISAKNSYPLSKLKEEDIKDIGNGAYNVRINGQWRKLLKSTKDGTIYYQ